MLGCRATDKVLRSEAVVSLFKLPMLFKDYFILVHFLLYSAKWLQVGVEKRNGHRVGRWTGRIISKGLQ